jgi:hypothetical protein
VISGIYLYYIYPACLILRKIAGFYTGNMLQVHFRRLLESANYWEYCRRFTPGAKPPDLELKDAEAPFQISPKSLSLEPDHLWSGESRRIEWISYEQKQSHPQIPGHSPTRIAGDDLLNKTALKQILRRVSGSYRG